MRLHKEPMHQWHVSVAEAKVIQLQLAESVSRQDCLTDVEMVAGVDDGMYKPFSPAGNHAMG